MIVCTDCGHQCADGVQVCPNCEKKFYLATEDGLLHDAGDFKVHGPTIRVRNCLYKLTINVQESNQQFVLQGNEINNLLIGRYDANADVQPHIDLTDSNAIEHGVSRQHATLDYDEIDGLTLVDNMSTCGTYLNEQRTVPGIPLPLRDGDTIQLGKLNLTLIFNEDVHTL